jgi:hypothetical protein
VLGLNVRIIGNAAHLVGLAMNLHLTRTRIAAKKAVEVVQHPSSHSPLGRHVVILADVLQEFAGSDAPANLFG